MYPLFKRCLDLISSLFLFSALLPIFLFIWLLVRIKLGSPVFFMQERSGMHKKIFNIIKFRSMTNEKDSNGILLPDEQRYTSFGIWLRKTSLDELPELISIIKGDMSVIGPRPLPPRYNPYFTERENKRFEVRGGLISPEVLYNNVLPTWNEQLDYEATYVEQLSFINDIKIFLSVFMGLFIRYKLNQGGTPRVALDIERRKQKI